MNSPSPIFIVVFFATIATVDVHGQNGYVKFNKDSVIFGYLKYYTSVSNGIRGVELWKTKKDKNPRQIPLTRIYEYAIGKDTMRVLNDFEPFPGKKLYFEIAEAKIVQRGEVDLYSINNYNYNNSVSSYTGGGLLPALIDQSLGNMPYLFVLEESETNYLRAVPDNRESLMEVLADFLPDSFLIDYEKLNGKIKYKDIPRLVKEFNSRK